MKNLYCSKKLKPNVSFDSEIAEFKMQLFYHESQDSTHPLHSIPTFGLPPLTHFDTNS